jgi:hypothetical protein
MPSDWGDELIAMAEVGRRLGETNFSGICIGDVILLVPRAGGGSGDAFGLLGRGSAFTASDFALVDLLGGGRLGLGLSSSCSSFAETNDPGEDILSLLSRDADVENRLGSGTDFVISSDLGRDCRDPLATGFVRGVVVLTTVNCGGFCFIGGVPSESFRRPPKVFKS